MLVGPARALFMDEISTGLDSSTTFQIVNSLRQTIHILGGTAVISLLQPAPETYDLFDDIILLSDGLIVYQGPRESVVEFFESMGFKCPERKGVADFLQEVAEELSVPFDKSKNHPAALTTTSYGVSNKEVLKANIARELLLMKRNSFVYIFRAFQTMGVAFMKSRGVFPEAKWYWIGFGALIGYVLLFNALFTLALTYLNREYKSASGMERKSSSLGSMREAFEQNKKGMVLPFTPLSITFDDVRYSVDMPQEMKAQGVVEDRLELLKGVSGSFRPGVLTALMGVSGAGKTTLMDVLAGRKTGGYIEGDIRISGYPKKQETFARISGYCEQNDIHSPHVTVHESLVYSAWLRLPSEVDSETRKMFVEEVMELVELTPLRDALVGLPGVDGLSTEQRKRLTIAVELVANPSIIFMDEPTSGLDARAAAIVMRTVRNTVDTGRTVVCTIHQPSIDIFEAFDEVSRILRRNKNLIKELSIPPAGSSDLYFPTQYSQSLPVQCMACLWKQHLSYWRNPPYTAVRFFFTIVVALMFGTIFWDLGRKT
ncbi:hypothetical protein BHM03_00010839 [Ensete ventricosum]|nr:hypothetical protein BHM03_00010839 [Ensete ventricosum]